MLIPDWLEGTGRAITETWKVGLAGAGVGLALVWQRLSRRTQRVALWSLVAVSFVNYARWGAAAALDRVDAYDLVHYYLNAKYFPELGYYDLYPAVITVDHEHDGPRFAEPPRYRAQDASGHHLEPIAHALARGEVLKQDVFTPERWAAFEHDFLYLQRGIHGFDLDKGMWADMIQDHGFNGTTAWLVVAEPLAEAVPIESVKLLGYVDVALLAAAIAATAWAYGETAAAWCALWLLLTYSTRWPYISWGLLRYDWIALLMIGQALLRRGWPVVGGILTGFSATQRMFPVLWFFGPFAQGLWGLARKQLRAPLVRYGLGGLLGIAALEGAAIARYGLEPIQVHLENMEDHVSAEQLSSRRIGLQFATTYRGTLLPKAIDEARRAEIDAAKPWTLAIGVVFCIALGLALRNKRPDEANAFGFLAFFLLTTASYYYYVARWTLLAVHAGELDKPRHRVGLASLLALEVFSNATESFLTGYRMFLIGWLAWGVCAYGLIQLVWIAIESRSELPARELEGA